MRFFYQLKNDGLPFNINVFSAFEGFTEMGYEAIPFNSIHLIEDKIEKEDIIVGTIPTVRSAWRALGVKIPELLDYPTELIPWRGRKIWTGILKDVFPHDAGGDLGWPVFVKPSQVQKGFGGRLVKGFAELGDLAPLPPDFPVWYSSPVKFISEYRVYVCEGEILGIGWYHGDNCIFPNTDVIKKMIKTYTSSPIAYALDVGINEIGQTLMVEVNDFFSLGNYSLEPINYAYGIQQRWREIVNASN